MFGAYCLATFYDFVTISKLFGSLVYGQLMRQIWWQDADIRIIANFTIVVVSILIFIIL